MDFLKDLTSYLKTHIGVVGFIGSALGTFVLLVTTATEVIQEPLYYGMIALLLAVLLSTFAVFTVIKSKTVSTGIVDPGGGSIAKTIGFYPVWLRVIAALAALGFWGVIAVYLYGLPAGTLHDHFFGIAYVQDVQWIGDGAGAVTKSGDRIPFARMVKLDDPDLLIIDGRAALLDFHLQKRSSVKKLRVKDIKVEVIDYKPLPPYTLEMVYGAGPVPDIYVAQIDAPSKAGRRVFTSSFLPDGSNQAGRAEPFRRTLIEDGTPKRIMLRILADTPGIYTIRCVIEVASDYTSETFVLDENKQFLFDRVTVPDAEPTPGDGPTN